MPSEMVYDLHTRLGPQGKQNHQVLSVCPYSEPLRVSNGFLFLMCARRPVAARALLPVWTDWPGKSWGVQFGFHRGPTGHLLTTFGWHSHFL